MERGLVQIYWGDGKGKTTAALGTALRALGNDYKVHLIQFMKNGAKSLEQEIPGEINSLSKFPDFSLRRFGLKEWYQKGKNDLEHKREVEIAFSYLLESIKGYFDIIIADEILYAVQLGLLEEERVINLIKNKPKDKELILTGSHIPLPKIFAASDLVTEMKNIKHPFDLGIKARKGIEY